MEILYNLFVPSVHLKEKILWDETDEQIIQPVRNHEFNSKLHEATRLLLL